MNNGVNYTIISSPSYIIFECPFCHEKVEIIDSWFDIIKWPEYKTNNMRRKIGARKFWDLYIAEF